jgi:hypothetical protein
MILRTAPAVFALLLLSAHFYRGGDLIPATVCVTLPLLLLVQRRMALRVVQFANLDSYGGRADTDANAV